MAKDGTFAGIVGRKNQRKVPIEARVQPREIAHASTHVSLGIEEIIRSEARTCCRHYLHETDGTNGGDGVWIAAGLDLDDGQNNFGRDHCLGDSG